MATTSILAAAALPRFIVIKSNDYSDNGYAYYKEEGNSIVLGETSVFSTLVKIEVERATISDKYVNLRFSYTNRYWARKADDKFVVAESDQPQEDVTKPSCTLFEPFKLADDKLYLSHVQSGGRVLVDGSTSMAFYVDDENPIDEEEQVQGYLTIVDWGTLIKLPKRIALKGDNEKYLETVEHDMGLLLQFSSNDPNGELSFHTVVQMEDGYVQILTSRTSAYWVLYDRNGVNYITGDLIPIDESKAHFWPVKIDDNTIALRSKFNNLFCKRYPGAPGADGNDILNATASTISSDAELQVKELVLGRKIYNVRYLMQYARIFDETPFVAGTETLINDAYSEASMGVEITYEDSKSYTFSRGLTLTAGTTASIEAGLPFIEKATITVSYEISGNFQWENTTTTTVGVTATGAVPVPARTTATIEYVGTRGTCNVPYTYTQEDQSSIDGQPIYTDQVDGIYTAVNYYNFSFHVVATEPLP